MAKLATGTNPTYTALSGIPTSNGRFLKSFANYSEPSLTRLHCNWQFNPTIESDILNQGVCTVTSVVEFGGGECALVSFLYTNGSLGVHTRCTLAGWLDVLLCELDNQLHRL